MCVFSNVTGNCSSTGTTSEEEERRGEERRGEERSGEERKVQTLKLRIGL